MVEVSPESPKSRPAMLRSALCKPAKKMQAVSRPSRQRP
jgi:hypothetical protein